jgi:hypothetical protein
MGGIEGLGTETKLLTSMHCCNIHRISAMLSGHVSLNRPSVEHRTSSCVSALNRTCSERLRYLLWIMSLLFCYVAANCMHQLSVVVFSEVR